MISLRDSMVRFFLAAFIFFALGQIADVALSAAITNPEFEEQNPFTRTRRHGFDLRRGIWVKLVVCCDVGMISAVPLVGFWRKSRDLAWFLAATPFLYFGLDVWLNAVTGNFLIWLGWFVP